jgi:hypothetical protein
MKLVLRILHMARKCWGTLSLAAAGIVGAALLNLVTPEVVRRLSQAADRRTVKPHNQRYSAV